MAVTYSLQAIQSDIDFAGATVQLTPPRLLPALSEAIALTAADVGLPADLTMAVNSQAIAFSGGGVQLGGHPDTKLRWSAPQIGLIDDIQDAVSITTGTEQVLLANVVYEATVAAGVVTSYIERADFNGLDPDEYGRVLAGDAIWEITLSGSTVTTWREITDLEGSITRDLSDIPAALRTGSGGSFGTLS